MTEVTAAPGSEDLDVRLERYRVELTGFCYRMLGSAFEAEDAVQETFVRGWRNFDRFEGRSSLRSWLYRIATNVCLDMVKGPQRRARPMDLGSPGTPEIGSLGSPLPEATWLQPMPDARIVPESGDPADVAASRETVRLAFVAALQHLPPRQRAVLILREVLRWSAAEVAELLESTVPSVNSALQRARATLTSAGLTETDAYQPLDDSQQRLLARYVDAFERYDIDVLVGLLHEEAVLSMPPYPLWLRGHADLRRWFLGPGIECRGSVLRPAVANGMPAFGQYRSDGAGGHAPWALQVLEVADGKVVGFNAFLDTAALFPLFGLPDRIPGDAMPHAVRRSHMR